MSAYFDLAADVARAEAERLVPRAASPAELGNRVGDVYITRADTEARVRVPFCGHELAADLEDIDESVIYEFLGFGDGTSAVYTGAELSCRADRLVSQITRIVQTMARPERERIAAVNTLLESLAKLTARLLETQEAAGFLPGSERRAALAEAERQEQALTRKDVTE